MNLKKRDQKQAIRVVVVDSDPLRLVGFRALLGSEPDFEFMYTSLSDPGPHNQIDIILLGNHQGQKLFDCVLKLRELYRDAQIIAIGSGMQEETIVAALKCGAKGYLDEAAPAVEFMSALRAVSRGSVWFSRQLLSLFVEQASGKAKNPSLDRGAAFTAREKQVLGMLVEGRSNKEIGQPLGMRVRTVKAHLAKLMRKVGVQNRVALSTYAISHALVSLGHDLRAQDHAIGVSVKLR
jgi:DNA-binding NarL/FixJ family response regulator